MGIRILPAQLASQIAAGEVVERPASVVKELVENSLDSEASHVEIHIKRGGKNLVRVRDDGRGISKKELCLALTRHATSKISRLSDLEEITSLGFRGEALASISAVSRLTLISRPRHQDVGWSAQSIGGVSTGVSIKPKAHPMGTTVEVSDLFFNTPGRRKFLRTERTEFISIDELLKRVALSRFDISITLKHNGKVVRKYLPGPGCVTTREKRRLSAVCGAHFVERASKIDWKQDGVRIQGWIASPDGARKKNDVQYCYVNGRVTRDKIISHAINQGYGSSIQPEKFTAYVLFLDIDPRQIDINVHPTKREIRFHHARLIHDFIYQAVASVLSQNKYIEGEETITGGGRESLVLNQKTSPSSTVNKVAQRSLPGSTSTRCDLSLPPRLSLPAWQEYPRLSPESFPSIGPSEIKIKSLGKVIALLQGKAVLMVEQEQYSLVSLRQMEKLKLKRQANLTKSKSQPLPVPLIIEVKPELATAVKIWGEPLLKLGIRIKSPNPNSIEVVSVPQILQYQNLRKLVPGLLVYALNTLAPNQTDGIRSLSAWLVRQLYGLIEKTQPSYTLFEAIQLILEVEQVYQGALPLNDKRLIQPVDFSPAMKTLYP